MILIPLIVGISLYDWLVTKASAYLLVLGLILSLCLIILLSLLYIIRSGNRQKRSILFLCLTGLAGISIGVLNRSMHDKRFSIVNLETKKARGNFSVVVVQADKRKGLRTKRYQVNIIRQYEEDQRSLYPVKAFLYCPNSTDFTSGDTLAVPDSWKAIKSSGNPFAPDFARACLHKDIYLQQYVDSNHVYILGHQHSKSILEHSRQYCLSIIERYIQDPDSKALLKAILVGEDHDIDPNVREQYAETGIIHIISISGAHVAMLFLLISLLLQWLPLRMQILKQVIAILFIWTYVLLSGAATPALRAAIFFSIGIIGFVSYQKSNPLHQLLVTASLMLLIQPNWLFQIGFQLSFMAVLSILLFYPLIFRKWKPQNRISLFLWKSISVSLAAEILIAPIVLYYFHQFPIWFLLSNILAAGMMSIILFLGLTLISLNHFSILAQAIASIISMCSKTFHHIISQLQALSPPCLHNIYLSALSLFLLYCLIICMSLYLFRQNKKALILALIASWAWSLNHLWEGIQVQQQNYLLVHNSSHESPVEIIRGNHYHSLQTAPKSPGHIRLQALQRVARNENELYRIQEKSILILDKARLPAQIFPIDILVINDSFSILSIHKACEILQPQLIVLSRSIRTKNANVWARIAKEKHIMLHQTRKEGSFVFPRP